MKVSILAAALLSVVSFGANAAAVTSLTITNGVFTMHTLGGNTAAAIGGSAFANLSTDDLAAGAANVTNGAAFDALVNPPVGYKLFDFFGAPVSVYTTAASSSDITGGALTLDLSTWTVFYTGNTIAQGPGAPTSEFAITAFDAGTGAFTAHWFAPVPVAFPGFTGEWTVNGVAVAAVPEPETYAMLLAGLGLVGAIARRRKAA